VGGEKKGEDGLGNPNVFRHENSELGVSGGESQHPRNSSSRSPQRGGGEAKNNEWSTELEKGTCGIRKKRKEKKNLVNFLRVTENYRRWC